MSSMDFIVGVLVSAASWMIGIALARYVMRKYLGWGDTATETSSTHTDDIVDFDKSERPYIPIRIIKEHGQYYAWFALNDSFIGQADKLYELRQMAHDNILKQIGLRLEFDIDLKQKKKP